MPELDTRPPIICPSCFGTGKLHYSDNGRVVGDVDNEPCWGCGGKGKITPDMVNVNGDSLYDIIAGEATCQS